MTGRILARIRTLRWRLTLFYCLLVALLLGAMSLFVYTQFEGFMRQTVATRLRDQAAIFGPSSIDADLFKLTNGKLGSNGMPFDPSTFKALMGRARISNDLYVALFNSDGTLVAADETDKQGNALNLDFFLQAPSSNLLLNVKRGAYFVDTELIAKGVRGVLDIGHGMAYVTPVFTPQGADGSSSFTGYLVVAGSLAEVDTSLNRLRFFLTVGVVGALLLALLLGLPLARLGLRPLQRIAATATQIGNGDLSRRVALPLASPASYRAQDEVQQLGEAFNAMLDKIEAAFTAQQRSEARTRQFAADASHELRSPLTVLGGYLDVLLMGAKDDPAQVARILLAMQRENSRLSRLVVDLLLLTRMDANGAGCLRLEPTPLSDVANRAADNMRVLAGERTLSVVVEEGLEGATLNADGDQLYRVIANLLDNAIRYTPEYGHITLRLGLASNWEHPAKHGRARYVALSVEDDGCGIAPDELPHVFDRFYRADMSRNRQTGNAGLGLSICRSIVEAHGGQISAESEPGRGTRFTVLLPLPAGAKLSANSKAALRVG